MKMETSHVAISQKGNLEYQQMWEGTQKCLGPSSASTEQGK